MLITDILESTCVCVPLAATDKQSAINELVDLIETHTPITGGNALKSAVWERETTRTTGIGHGIGIPHGKSVGCDRLRMAIGRAASPIEFQSIDGKPVDLIFLLASPVDQTGPHIQALARISKMLINADFRHALKTAPTSDALYQLIADAEAASV